LREGWFALALCCQRQAACLALLATPGFHAQGGQTLRLAFAADLLARLCGRGGGVPVEANSVLYPRSLYGGTQIHQVRNPRFRNHGGMMSAARAPDVLWTAIAN